jgi:hypothetical protein
MIEYINKRMIDWALWLKRREDGGLGYPGAANFSKLVSIHSDPGAGPITEGAAEMEIEGIVCKLRDAKPALYQVAYWIYAAGDLTMGRVAKELGCSRDTVYVRLHALHLHAMDALHENTLSADERKHSSSKVVAPLAKSTDVIIAPALSENRLESTVTRPACRLYLGVEASAKMVMPELILKKGA